MAVLNANDAKTTAFQGTNSEDSKRLIFKSMSKQKVCFLLCSLVSGFRVVQAGHKLAM